MGSITRAVVFFLLDAWIYVLNELQLGAKKLRKSKQSTEKKKKPEIKSFYNYLNFPNSNPSNFLGMWNPTMTTTVLTSNTSKL